MASSHARPVFGILAGLTGAALAACFIAPFYGALDRPVTVIEDDAAKGGTESGSGNGIVVEQFDYNEPDGNAEKAEKDVVPAEPAPDSGEAGLEREAPRPPLGDMGLASTPKPPEPAPPAAAVDESEPLQLLQRPVAVAAGRLESQGRIVDLKGIEILPVEESCQSASGESWPCGMQARTAFRQWLRSRAVMCRLPQNDSGAAVSTECRVGDEDAALWLVENGWAKASANGAYADAGRKAEEEKRGLYGDKPSTTLPDLGTAPDLSAPSPDAQPQPTEPQQSEPQSRPAQDGYFPPPPAPATPAPETPAPVN